MQRGWGAGAEREITLAVWLRLRKVTAGQENGDQDQGIAEQVNRN